MGGGGSLNNKNASSRRYAIVFGIFALVIVTTAASYAFFNYSRVGNTTNTITSGDIEFTFKEGDSANLSNAFPVSDEIGANDETEQYTFTVNLKSTSASNKMNYNVWLLDNNKGTDKYFNNEQIKFALIKDGTFVAGTSSTSGIKLSDIDGFTAGERHGEGIVLENQEIISGKTDEYKLRIWISDDVNYSNTENNGGSDEQTSIGKFNAYKYSLKVKITSGIASSTEIGNVSLNKLTFTTTLEDENGLNSYAVTTSSKAPANDSSEWIEITNETAAGNVLRTSDSKITSKTIEYMVKRNGIHYLHVKNDLGQVKSKTFTANATGENAVDKIVGLAETNTNELRIDEHAATGQQDFATKEYRYYGKTPNNYVWFNNELWRIIGAMDVDDGSGTAGNVGNVDKRLKIIRANSIGNYSWDSSDLNTNLGYGVNEWNQADLMTLLNSGAYYNRTAGTCYTAQENATTPCNFSENSSTPGLTIEAKEMIGNAKWYLGAGPDTYQSLTCIDFYGYERGTDSGKQCSSGTKCDDSVTRKTYWTGQIGLIYPSDYGYSANMNSCASTALNSYSTSCRDSVWLYNNANHQWTLTPYAFSSNAFGVFRVDSTGYLDTNAAIHTRAVSPVTYLLPDIKILDGDGTTERPFVLSK